jgi:2-(1,2-epoxy-1,2-dihydrophenyl)acetyl-CoA isomerase
VELRAVVESLYVALARGDRDAVAALLRADFTAVFSEGLPFGIGGARHGLEAIDLGWWEMGRHYAVRAEPTEWIECAGGRLLVLGAYTGRARSSGAAFEAAFAHLWSGAGGRLHRLVQITDTALWPAD